MATAGLKLISFADRSQSSDLERILDGLGYGFTVLSGPEWLSRGTEDATRLSLLLIARTDLPFEEVVRILKSRGSSPALALFDCRDIGWIPEIVDCCDEFSCWPCHEEELALRLKRLLPDSAASLETDAARIAASFMELDMIGQSPRFLQAMTFIKRVARCDAPVLIQGETGTGKEMAARAVHYLGARREFPFTPVNCGAIPDNLLENELFGHERGAFTDAREAQRGLVAQAEGGSLFLDEVDTLSVRAQVSLLRFLQDFKYKPLGDKRLRKANVRILAATNVDLQELVMRGEFRQDLWFRLNVVGFTLPSLSERPGDARLLAEYFLREYSNRYGQASNRFEPSSLAWIDSHDWPGNVRELENLVHRAVVTSDGPLVDICGFVADETTFVDSPRRDEIQMPHRTFREAKSQAIAEFEKEYLVRSMAEAQGNVTLAAKRAGKERRAFGKLLKKYGISRKSYSCRA